MNRVKLFVISQAKTVPNDEPEKAFGTDAAYRA
jgi:hypothetical protein